MNFLTEDEHRKGIIAMLIKLKKADKKETPQEWAYILQVGASLGLEDSEIELIKNNHTAYSLKPPQTEKERMTILYYLLFFMRIDGEISKEEENMVKEFGFILGFRTNLTHDLIEVIKSHADKHIPPAEMIKAITKYLN